LHINSPGGEVFDGITIYNLIKQHPANVTTYIDGLAASIASVIALAGDSVIMAENALYMIHNPWGFAMGDATEMRKTADLLDKVAGSLVTAYTSKTGKPDDDIQTLLDAETWMTAQEAKDAGFIDEISEQMDMAACAKFIPAMQKAKFKNIPENLSGNKQTPTAREAEKALRDVGFTQAQAKSILADGFKGDQRDVAPVADQRDVAAPEPKKKDRVADLLTRAELMAPSH
jgi:ClpP class serine protease